MSQQPEQINVQDPREKLRDHFRQITQHQYLTNFNKQFEQISQGSSCVVFRGLTSNNKRVALKEYRRDLIKKNNSFIESIVREVKMLKEFKGKNHIIQLVDCIRFFDQIKGYQYVLITELCEQGTIEDIIDQIKAKPTKKKLQYCLKVSQLVQFLHNDGKIHRDIKTQNIFVTMQNGQYEFKLGDLGSSREKQLQMTAGVGTPLQQDPRRNDETNYENQTDIFALGVTLVKIFTGQYFFKYQRLSYMQFRQRFIWFLNNLNKQLKSGLKSFDQLIKKCLSLNSKPSSQQIIQTLKQIIASLQQSENNQQDNGGYIDKFHKNNAEMIFAKKNTVPSTQPNQSQQTLSNLVQTLIDQSDQNKINHSQVPQFTKTCQRQGKQIEIQPQIPNKKSSSSILFESSARQLEHASKINEQAILEDNIQNLIQVITHKVRNDNKQFLNIVNKCKSILHLQIRKIDIIHELQNQSIRETITKYILVLLGFMIVLSNLTNTYNKYKQRMPEYLRAYFEKTQESVKKMAYPLFRKLKERHSFQFTNRRIISNQIFVEKTPDLRQQYRQKLQQARLLENQSYRSILG